MFGFISDMLHISRITAITITTTGVQLVEIDRERMDAIQDQMAMVRKQASEFFTRANDHFFDLPDGDYDTSWKNLNTTLPENFKKVTFRCKVQAYSGVGDGGVFEVNFGSGTFKVVGDIFLKEGDDSIKNGYSEENRLGQTMQNDDDDQFEDDFFEATREIECMSEGEDSDSDDESDSEPDDDESTSESDDESVAGTVYAKNLEGETRKFKPTSKDHYNPAKMFTGVEVSFHQEFGRILATGQKSKELRQKNEYSSATSATEQRGVIARGLAIAVDCLQHKRICISDSKSDIPDFHIVRKWKNIPRDAFYRETGWARRPEKDLYGKTYMTDEILWLIADWYLVGSDSSSEKISPAIMQERLHDKYPGLYCLPSQSIISKKISAMSSKEKSGADPIKRPKQQLLPKIKARIKELIQLFPTLTGKPIEAKIAREYNGSQKPEGYDRMKIMAKVNALRSEIPRRLERDYKRSIIG